MTKDDYSLPQLPPLEDVLKLVKPSDQKSSAKKTSLIELINELKENMSPTQIKQLADYLVGTKIPNLPTELNYECPILKRETGDGAIKVFIRESQYGKSNIVVCKCLSGVTCNLASSTYVCPYINV